MYFKTLFAILILITLASASSPWLISDSDTDVSFSGHVNLDRGADSKINWIEATYYIAPQDTLFQSAELVSAYPQDYTIAYDTFGNKYIKITWKNPTQDTLDYSFKWKIHTDRFKYAIVDDQPTLPYKEDTKKFIESDNLTWWTGYMSEKASSIVGQSTGIEAIKKLTNWISENLVYDKAYWKSSKSSEDVFYGRRGVCDEFTNLFISYARSLGIPTRYVEGLVYSGEEWNFHAWAEVYVGDWISIDPTYNEIGFVDSSHVLLARVHSDNDVHNSIRWEGKNIDAYFNDEDFEVNLYNSSTQPVIYADIITPENAIASEIFYINASLLNLANSYLVATCSINMPVEMLLLDEKEKSALLSPKGNSTLSWRVAAPQSLEQNLPHIMPVQIVCFPGFNKTVEMGVDPRTSVEGVSKASIIDLTVLNSTDSVVSIRNEGTRNLKEATVSLCVDSGILICTNQSIKDLNPGEKIELTFSKNNIEAGDRVYAEIASSEFEKTSVETKVSGAQDAKKPRINGTSASTQSQMVLPEGMESIIVIVLVVFVIFMVLLIIITHLKKY